MNRPRTHMAELGFNSALEWAGLGRDRPPEPENPYKADYNRSEWERGYREGRSEYFKRKGAEENARKLREAEAEAERLANRTLREQLYEARDFDDLKAVLERMLNEREAE
jgi:hypothetical protein